jgi:hypothetical protein
MKISGTQRERLEYACEDLKISAHLVEEILAQNPDSNRKEVKTLLKIWKLLLEADREIRNINRESYERAI